MIDSRLDRLTRQILMYESLSKEKQHFDLVFDLAAKLLDFPTDEQVEAAIAASHIHPNEARAALEAVRRIMYGGSDD